MSISLNANFELLSAGLYLDARQQFNTIIEMKDFAETSIPDGFITYNKETQKHYVFSSSNTVDTTLGKWREYNSGTSTSYAIWVEGIDYKVGDIVLKDNIKRQCIVEHTSADFDVEKDNWMYVFEQYYYVSQAQYNQMIANGIITDETKDLYIIDGNTNGNDNENAGIEIYEDYSQFPMDFEFDCVVYAKNEHTTTEDEPITYPSGFYFGNSVDLTWTLISGSGGQIGNIITIVDNTVTNSEVIGAKASYEYFAKREIYGDTVLNIGRKEGSEVGQFSGAIGKDCVASAMYSVAMGEGSVASGKYTLAKGNSVTASGECSSAEGYETTSSGWYSHAEGANTESKGWYSHAEGNTTLSKAQNSHCEGFKTITEGQSAHAEGEETLAKGDNSHTQGKLTIANGLQSSAEGLGTIASGDNQTVLGKYNLEDKNHTYALIIGSGVDDSSRNNIYTIDWAGNGKHNGDVIATDAYGNEVSLLTLANNIGGGFYTETFVGNNSKSITINHNIGNPNVSAKVYDATTNKEVEFEIELTSGINLTLKSDILLTPDMKFKIIVTL